MQEAINGMNSFFDHVYTEFKAKKVPIYFLKFEELRSKPRETLRNVFKFILNTESIEGTVIEKRIDEVLDLGHEATQAYKLKPHDSKFNKHYGIYSEEVRDMVLGQLYEYN